MNWPRGVRVQAFVNDQGIDLQQLGPYLTSHTLFLSFLQKSISAQIRQLILYFYEYEE